MGFISDLFFGGKAAKTQAKASDAAAQAQLQGVRESNALMEKMYNQTRADYQPWRQAGMGALGEISNPANVLNNFQASPDYNFRLQRGLQGVTQNQAVNGLLKSGSALKALNDYAGNSASQEFGNWWNRQAGLAGVGQAATGAVSQAGQNYGNNAGNNILQGANAQASSYLRKGDIWSGYYGQLNSSLNNGANMFAQFMGGL